MSKRSQSPALHFVQHPSSDLASLGHLLPQGEKEKRRRYISPSFSASWRKFWRGRGPICWMTSPAASEPRSPHSFRLRPVV